MPLALIMHIPVGSITPSHLCIASMLGYTPAIQHIGAMRRRLSDALHAGLRNVYYRYAFGRHLPFPASLRECVARWERRRCSGDIPLPPEAWDSQYRSGKWAFMQGISDAQRYGVIIAYLLQCKPGGSVLDIGCGEGILFQRLRPHGYSRYLGIDISREAVERVSTFQDASTTFVCADAEAYTPSESFDAIVFNETLYYFNDPLTTLVRYAGVLAEAGIIVVSTYLPSQRGVATLELAKSRFAVLDEVHVRRGAKASAVTVFTVGNAGGGA